MRKRGFKKDPFKEELHDEAAALSAVPERAEIEVAFKIASPPRVVKSIKDLIHWEYAKIVAESAGMKDQYGFIMSRFNKLKNGEMKWKDAEKDAKDYLKEERKCIYCGSASDLTIDHIIPQSKGGPDIAANSILACKSCNSSKGDKDVFEWYYVTQKKASVPNNVWKKYLKLIWDFHALHRTLDKSDLNEDGHLNILDLNVIFHEKKKKAA